MKLDDDICYCYHVSLRKLINFARREQPEIPSRMSECLGAGTGCGWCIPILCKIAESAREGRAFAVEMTPEEYAERRREYRKGGDKNQFEGTGPAPTEVSGDATKDADSDEDPDGPEGAAGESSVRPEGERH